MKIEFELLLINKVSLVQCQILAEKLQVFFYSNKHLKKNNYLKIIVFILGRYNVDHVLHCRRNTLTRDSTEVNQDHRSKLEADTRERLADDNSLEANQKMIFDQHLSHRKTFENFDDAHSTIDSSEIIIKQRENQLKSASFIDRMKFFF